MGFRVYRIRSLGFGVMRAFHEACKTLQFTCKGFHKRQPALRGRVGRYDFMSGPFSRDNNDRVVSWLRHWFARRNFMLYYLASRLYLGG